ncbi:SAV_2336 N-terminal domain-related protein [Streptomyces sp. DH24]|uniref:SAV_2336 N-terminal domain-related protein n=1 Tax=Streptomyces sp. DH24 TaxID=3040123 RepID=UPI0024415974|nr:SAV_2336 N-terminal domain-related protein [Streptomyces sp. DH24]MDG9717089.1 SAV_2336 N-terminal domain-related protein [Streptomyces sp. DH24]
MASDPAGRQPRDHDPTDEPRTGGASPGAAEGGDGARDDGRGEGGNDGRGEGREPGAGAAGAVAQGKVRGKARDETRDDSRGEGREPGAGEADAVAQGKARDDGQGKARDDGQGKARDEARHDSQGEPRDNSRGKAREPGASAADAVGRLRAVLGAVRGDAAGDAGPTPRELAEVLWLAGQLGAEGDGDSDAGPGRPAAPPASTPHGGPPPAAPADVPRGPRPPRPEPPSDGRVPLHLPAPRPGQAAGGDGTPLLAPAPPMLHHPLALQRALRPLKRKVPSPHARVLDEHATADRIARLGAHPDAWLPVLRPAPDRWLRLNLVHDTGPTMPVWRPLVRELHTVLAQSGIFRTITLHPAGPDGRVRQVPDPADGRTVTLVVSDCMGPQWRPGPAGDRWYRTLRRWSARMPVAVVQPLPEHLWHTTALPAEPGLLTPPAAAAPSAALAFAPYDPDAAPPPPSAVPVPVLAPGPSWLAHWAALLGDPGGGRTPGAAAWLPPAPVPPAETARDIAALGPEELVLRFRGTASPEAFRLAGHLSLAVPALPVMRLVQHVLLRDPRPQHLAEIILSGMLTAVPGPPGSYAFRPGVRDLLHRSLPRTARGRTREFLARVGGLIDERAGLAAGDFRAEARRRPSDGGDAAIATVSEETVRRLGADEPGRLVGGRYRLVGQRGQGRRVWRAVDEETGRTVVVHRYPERAAPREGFLREAEVLAGIRDPHLVPVLDYGVDGETPYLVARFVDGVTLTELWQGNGPLPYPVFERLVHHVTAGLRTLHAHGLAWGQRDRAGLLLCPDGTAMISRFALGDRPDRSDADAFRSLLHELGDHAAPHRRLLELLADGRLPEPARTPDRDRLRFTLLGPLRVSRYQEPLELPSPEAQALLCMLLLRHGRPVLHAELVRGLWPTPPPPAEAAARVSGLVAELRRLLGPGVLATPSYGLALHVPDAFIDVIHCEDLLPARGREPEPPARRARIQQALDLFHGDPLDGVPGPAAATARARLRALRLTLCATRAELDIALGDFGRATEDLTALLRDHPDHEEFRRLHARARRGSDAPHASRAARPTIVLEADHLTDTTRDQLGSYLSGLLARGGLAPHQYEMLTRANGHVVLTEPGTDVHSVLAETLPSLRFFVSGLEPRPRVRTTFWDTAWFASDGQQAEPPGLRSALDRIESDAVVIAPPLHEEFTARRPEYAGAFEPLRTGPDASPSAWYHTLDIPHPAAEPARDLVRGPLPLRPTTALPGPVPGRTAIVPATADGRHSLLRPDGRPTHYYEVDLTPRHATRTVSLPAFRHGFFAASVKLSWHVDDPVAFVRSDTADVLTLLLNHLTQVASRLTRRHTVRRVGAAQRAVQDGLRDWPVPGLAVSCSVRLAPRDAPEGPPRPAPPRAPTPADLLKDADAVLLGFDGPLTRLFSRSAARSAALELLSLVTENRDPADALDGRPLTPSPDNTPPPLDVLRAYAHDPRLAPRLRDRLDRLELRAAEHSAQNHNATSLVVALAASRFAQDFAVVTDVSRRAVLRHLQVHSLSGSVRNVHGRSRDTALLMPDPDCLRRALGSFRSAPRNPVVIGSSPAELAAAQALDLPFLAVTDNLPDEDRLRERGCQAAVRLLSDLVDAVSYGR